MNPLKQNVSGRLHLTQGIKHIVGYKVTGFYSPSKAEFAEGHGVYTFEPEGVRIEDGEKITVTLENAPMDPATLAKAHIELGGVIIQLMRTTESYYIQPRSSEVVENIES